MPMDYIQDNLKTPVKGPLELLMHEESTLVLWPWDRQFRQCYGNAESAMYKVLLEASVIHHR